MKFGLMLPVEHASDDDIAARVENVVEVARTARDAGFRWLEAPQHLLAAPNQYLQPLPLLARVAGESGDMELATNILLISMLHPVAVAETTATLDVICGGRFVLGVGLGYRDAEFDAFGVGKGTRLSRFLESLELIKRLWTEESVDFEGRHFHLEGASLGVRPLRKPRPPILLAASGDRMVRRCARIADAWTAAGHAGLDTLARQTDLYREALAGEGKPFPPPRFQLCKELYVGPDMETARREAMPYVGAKYASYYRWGQDDVLPDGETFDRPVESLAEDLFIIGDPGHCIEQIERHRERLGLEEMAFRMHWLGMPHARMLRSIELFAERVMPAFA